MVRINSDLIFIDTSGQVISFNGPLTLRTKDDRQHPVIIGSGSHLRPDGQNVTILGHPDFRWSNLYTSEARVSGNIVVAGNIYPEEDSLYNIGASFLRFASINSFSGIFNFISAGDILCNTLTALGDTVLGGGGTSCSINSTSINFAARPDAIGGTELVAFLSDISTATNNIRPVDARQVSGYIIPDSDTKYNLGGPSRKFSAFGAASGFFEYLIASNGSEILTSGNLIPAQPQDPGDFDSLDSIGMPMLRYSAVHAASGVFYDGVITPILNAAAASFILRPQVGTTNVALVSDFAGLTPVDGRSVSGHILPNASDKWKIGVPSNKFALMAATSGSFDNILANNDTTKVINVSGALIPFQNTTYDLGSSSFQWFNIHAFSITGWNSVIAFNATVVGLCNVGTIAATSVGSNLIPDANNTRALGSTASRYSEVNSVKGNISDQLVVSGFFPIIPVHKDFVLQNVVNTAAETTVFNYNIPAGQLGPSGCLRLRLVGDYLNNTGAGTPTLTLRIKLGATTIYADASAANANSASRRPFDLNIILANQDSNSSQVLGGYALFGAAGGATNGIGDFGTDEIQATTPLFGTAAINTTTDQAFAVTIQHSTNNANLSFRKMYALLELIK